MDIFIGHYLDLYKTLTIQIAVQASLTGTLWQQDKRKIKIKYIFYVSL